jgi:hypothetical protein
VRRPLEHPVALQEAQVTGQRRLVDGEQLLELLEARLAPAGDGREDAEL